MSGPQYVIAQIDNDGNVRPVGPDNPLKISGSGGGGVVDSIVAGDNISVDDTDPANPIVTGTLVLGTTAGTALEGDTVIPPSADSIPILAALISAGFGEPGEVLATNSGGDGFEWITP